MEHPFLREEPFVRYGISHWCMLVLLVLAAGFLVWLGRRIRSTSSARTCRRGLVCVILGFQVPFQIYSSLPPHWNLATSLPFQLCDLAWMAAVYALWTERAWTLGLLYFWGLTLTPQALLTPQLDFDFPHLQFIMFWGSHSLVVLAAIFMTWGLGKRPDWRQLVITAAVTLAWGLLMLLFNSLAGTNYLYVNKKPPVGTVLDLFGPWPYYLFVELAVILAIWTTMTLPWYLAQPKDTPPGS